MTESAAAQAPAIKELSQEVANKHDNVFGDDELPKHLLTKCHWCHGRGCGSCKDLGYKKPARTFVKPSVIL